MPRSLTLAVTVSVSLLGAAAFAHDGYHPPGGGGCGCRGFAPQHVAFEPLPYPPSQCSSPPCGCQDCGCQDYDCREGGCQIRGYQDQGYQGHEPHGGGCQGGACQDGCCSGGGQPSPGVYPSYQQPMYQQPASPEWQPQGSPSPMPTYNNDPVINPAHRYLPRNSPPTAPSSPPLLNSPPPFPSEARRQPMIPQEMEGIAQLPTAEQRVALRQSTCPVTKEPLGSMGMPILVQLSGRSMYVCCEGCVTALQHNPAKYLTDARRPSMRIIR